MKRIDKYSLNELRAKFISILPPEEYDRLAEDGRLLLEFIVFCEGIIPTKPRIATINTVEEFYNAKEEYSAYCGSTECDDCKYFADESECFSKFLAEEVEV